MEAVVLAKVLLGIALFFGLSLVLPRLDAACDDYIPYFKDYGMAFVIGFGILAFIVTVKTMFLFWSVRDMMKAIYRIYDLGAKRETAK